MTLYLGAEKLCKAYGVKALFQKLSFSIFAGERLGIIGPNGSGKSTLLKILAGVEPADNGVVTKKKGLKVGYVPQMQEFDDIRVEQVLLDSYPEGSSIADYEKMIEVRIWLTKLGFKGDEPSASRLSGGWKKRLSIAKELLHAPDLLLLDEPTNHLDLEGILWLEKFLLKEVSSYILVSHDRYFLQNMVNAVMELNSVYPNGQLKIEGPYAKFLELKEQFLEGQLQQERSIASKARREQEWLRQSPKARTTKAKGRVDEANAILGKLKEVEKRNDQKRTDVSFSASERETKKLIVAKSLCKSIGERVLFKGLDFTLSPGSRIGLMGANGSGKTTLLKLLAGELEPDGGTLKRADNLKVVYFDQHRLKLPGHLSLKDALSPTGDFVNYHGHLIHVNGWCKRFLFSPDILDMPIEKLSGGERARISIAHLMLQPADILLLDEPTNDLDISTLEALEESLLDFPGAIVLITHDRCMMDRVCNAFLAIGDLNQTELFADYRQWEEKKQVPRDEKKKEAAPEKNAPAEKLKLSFKEKFELEQIEKNIPLLEEKLKKLNDSLSDEEIALNPAKLQELCLEIAKAEAEVERLYLRWSELA